MTLHILKTAPEPFAAIAAGDKVHEIRVDDRDYRVGDTVHLHEWTEGGGYTGQALYAAITYKSEGGTWGLPPELCVLSLNVRGSYASAPPKLRRHDATWTAGTWIHFRNLGAPEGRKTNVYDVVDSSNRPLGVIQWYGAWRCYSFYPHENTLFEKNCLREIAQFCEEETERHREARQSS